MKLDTAIILATKAHHGQKDKQGQTYILHPLRVMRSVLEHGSSVTTNVENLAAVAVLHDVVEDTPVTLEYLRSMDDGLTDQQCEWLDALTHRPKESRLDYIKRICHYPEAAFIKRMDIRDNVGRLDGLDMPTVDRLARKYAKDLVILNENSAQ